MYYHFKSAFLKEIYTWLDSPVFPSSLLCCKNDKLNSAIMFKVLVKPSASILKCKDFMVAYRRYSTAQSKLTVLTQSARLDPCVLKLERFEFCDARIESQVSGFEFWEARFLLGINFVFLLHIHAAIQKFVQMISDCSVAFFNCLNCLLRQAFNKRKSIFLVSKIYPAYTVYFSWVSRIETRVTVNLLLSSTLFTYENQTTGVLSM